MKGFRTDDKTWPGGRYKFRVELSRSYWQAASILNWAEGRYEQPISESDIKQAAARESWAYMPSLVPQLHGDLISPDGRAHRRIRDRAPHQCGSGAGCVETDEP